MKDSILTSAARVLSGVLRDEPWQDIGFSRRPRHGALFQRFRWPWKVTLENLVLQEMIALFSTAYVLAGEVQPSDLDSLVHLYADGFGSTTNLFRTLGFSSRREAIVRLSESIRRYLDEAPSEWPRILAQRLRIDEIPDEKLAAQLFVGVIRFTRSVQGMPGIIQIQARQGTG